MEYWIELIYSWSGKNLAPTLGKLGCLSLLAKLRAVGFMMCYSKSDTPLGTTRDSLLTDIVLPGITGYIVSLDEVTIEALKTPLETSALNSPGTTVHYTSLGG